MKKFRVYFEQVNQTYYDVEAASLNSAIQKATRQWERCEGKSPNVMSTAEIKAAKGGKE